MTLPHALSEAEQDLLDAVAQGRPFDCSSRDQAADDPAYGASWGEGRTIRASVIRALCVGGDGIPKPDPRGISIVGARIEGSLDLESVAVTVPLSLAGCHFQERVNCREAGLKLLDLAGSFLRDGLDGTGCVFGQLLLRHGLVCRGVMRLVGAKVAGFLDCSGATLDNPSGNALLPTISRSKAPPTCGPGSTTSASCGRRSSPMAPCVCSAPASAAAWTAAARPCAVLPPRKAAKRLP